jgi:hypothetical protein
MLSSVIFYTFNRKPCALMITQTQTIKYLLVLKNCWTNFSVLREKFARLFIVLEKITKYRHNWVKHVHCMNNSRFPKALIEYHPRGRRHPGRPLKHLLDGVQTETKTGHMGLIS